MTEELPQTENEEPELAKVYPSTMEGLRQLGRDSDARRASEADAAPAPMPVPEVPREEPKPVEEEERVNPITGTKERDTLRGAAKALAARQQELAEQRAALDETLGAPSSETSDVEPTESDAPPVEDLDDIALQRIVEGGAGNANLTPEDYSRAVDLLSSRMEAKHYEAQVKLNAAHLEAHSRVQAAGSSFAQLHHQLQGELTRRFGIQTQDDLLRIAADPQLGPHLAKFVNEADQALAPHAAELQRQQSAWGEQNERFLQSQDQDFELAIDKEMPELKDPKRRGEVEEAALNWLRNQGLSDSDIGALWSGRANVPFRHKSMQLALAKVAMWDLAREKARTATKKPTPQVQRPGVAGPRMPNNYAEIAALLRKPSLTPREAAKLSMLRREERS